VPYFLVRGGGIAEGAPAPTVLYGYGGFEIAMTPGYSATVGESFLTKGMCYAVACIRGGGEFGARWHRAAKKEKRWRAYEDFAAVAKDLVKTGVTTHATLGCMGGSNGGLLTGAMMTHYPHLFGAVVSQCPLLDMERYVLLTSGPSWIDEYGDPSKPDERAALLGFSPYHNLEKSVENAVKRAGVRRSCGAPRRARARHALHDVHRGRPRAPLARAARRAQDARARHRGQGAVPRDDGGRPRRRRGQRRARQGENRREPLPR
jgi:hypothetical protein